MKTSLRIPVLVLAAVTVPVLGACSRGSDPAASSNATAPTGAQVAESTAEEKPKAARAGNASPTVAKAEIAPLGVAPGDFHPAAGDTLKASAEGSDADGDGVTLSYEWFVNGNPAAGAISDQFRGPFKKGDVVKVEVRARDTRGAESASAASAEVKIKNSPPKITSNPGGSLNGYKVTAVDPDGDPLTYTLEAPVPGFSLGADGTLSFDPAAGKEASGKTLMILVKDDDSAITKQSISVNF